jgi:hypothetical protein
MSRKMKSLLVFGVVIAVLGLTGAWLHDGGWLQMPRIFDVPTVLGGSDTASNERGPMGGGEARPQGNDTRTPPSGGGERHEQASGLNWDMLPGVLANLWIIAAIITAGVYGTRVFGFVATSIRFRRAPAAA